MKDLKKANQLIKDIAKKHKEITPMTPKDMPLFEKFFKKERHTYGNSWTYITQGKYGIGPYGLGYKYYDGNNLSSFSIYPHMEKPGITCIYWTRPMGDAILDIIDSFSKDLFKTYGMPTYVKKLFKDQYNFLIKKGFKSTNNFPWHSDCPSEDDTFPEVIIDAEANIDNKPKREAVRNILKRYRKVSAKVIVEQIKNESQRELAWKVSNSFFKQHLKTLEQNISTSFDFYNPIFSSMSDKHKIFLIKQGSIEKGIFDLEKLNHDYFAGYMALMLREELQDLNEFSIIFRCLNILDQNGKYLNLGGSETIGLHEFKSKFTTAIENQMYWVVYF